MTCAEKGWWINWTKDVEDLAVKQEEKRKNSEEVYGCSHGG